MYKPFKINWVIKISPVMLVNSLQSQMKGLQTILHETLIARDFGFQVLNFWIHKSQ